MPTRVAQPVRPDLSQQHASRAGDRAFTGNANIRSATGMETLTSDTAHRLSTSAAFPKPVASTQPAFTIGSAAASVSPSKKRMHNALKTRQGSAAASTTLPPRANPFAQYGVANGVSSSQTGRATARGSPVAAQSGFGSPQPSSRRSLKTVRRSDGAQGMNIDLTAPLEAAAADLIKSNASSQLHQAHSMALPLSLWHNQTALQAKQPAAPLHRSTFLHHCQLRPLSKQALDPMARPEVLDLDRLHRSSQQAHLHQYQQHPPLHLLAQASALQQQQQLTLLRHSALALALLKHRLQVMPCHLPSVPSEDLACMQTLNKLLWIHHQLASLASSQAYKVGTASASHLRMHMTVCCSATWISPFLQKVVSSSTEALTDCVLLSNMSIIILA